MMSSTISRWVLSGSDAPVVSAPEIETDEDLARRNAERLAAAKERLGLRYLLHPSNRVNRVEKDPSRVVLLRAVAARPAVYERAA